VRALFIVSCAAVVTGLAGCDAILGIHAVPVPGSDGSFDASVIDVAPDVPFDAFVGPDSPFDGPDGCNGGAENCSNGIDDNCDGLIDCADPLCIGAGFQCTPPAPGGWSGPVSFAAAVGSTIPVCGGAYGAVGTSGHGGLSAAAAMCGCACPSPATGTTCSASVALFDFPDNGCGATSPTVYSVGGCTDINTAGSVSADAGVPTSLGSCAANASNNVSPATWGNSYVACNYTAPFDTGGCDAGGQCVAKPTGVPKPCVVQVGDLACPGGAYSQKTLVMTSFSDTRDCSTCSCNPSGGACSVTVTAYTGSGCTGTAIPFAANGGCAGQGDSVVSAAAGAPVVTAASCSPSGGTAIGSATATGPVTVCCAP
jgi:hypothetical protein